MVLQAESAVAVSSAMSNLNRCDCDIVIVCPFFEEGGLQYLRDETI